MTNYTKKKIFYHLDKYGNCYALPVGILIIALIYLWTELITFNKFFIASAIVLAALFLLFLLGRMAVFIIQLFFQGEGEE